MDYSFFAPPTQPYQFFSLPDKPTHAYTPHTEVQQNPLDAFNDPSTYSFFDQPANFDTSTFIPPSHSPREPLARQDSLSQPVNFDRPGSIVNEQSNEADLANQALERSSDDDKESMTPAQSRRKAQNRAAQRAFRERKEKHVKELEVKLKSIEAQSTDLLTDNERLRRELDRLTTQNEILRQTSVSSKRRGHPDPDNPITPTLEAGPMAYSPKSFNAAFPKHDGSTTDESLTHEITFSPTGERYLATGAAWELINAHPLRPTVDLAQVVDRLREKIHCNGHGPSFLESEIFKAIEESGGVPGDELI